MNASADAADQVVRMSLNGAEFALKITGSGAKSVGKLLIDALKSSATQQRKTKGSIRLHNLVRSGKKLDVAEIADSGLKRFCESAKKYGILYTVLKDRNVNDGKTEIMYKSEDKEKINRIIKKLGLLTVDMAEVKEEVAPDLTDSELSPPERAGRSDKEANEFMDKLTEKANPTKEKVQKENPTQTRTDKPDPSVSSSKGKREICRDTSEDSERSGRTSVREELKRIREEQRRQRERERKRSPRTPARANEHKHIPKKKNEKER